MACASRPVALSAKPSPLSFPSRSTDEALCDDLKAWVGSVKELVNLMQGMQEKLGLEDQRKSA